MKTYIIQMMNKDSVIGKTIIGITNDEAQANEFTSWWCGIYPNKEVTIQIFDNPWFIPPTEQIV